MFDRKSHRSGPTPRTSGARLGACRENAGAVSSLLPRPVAGGGRRGAGPKRRGGEDPRIPGGEKAAPGPGDEPMKDLRSEVRAAFVKEQAANPPESDLRRTIVAATLEGPHRGTNLQRGRRRRRAAHHRPRDPQSAGQPCRASEPGPCSRDAQPERDGCQRGLRPAACRRAAVLPERVAASGLVCRFRLVRQAARPRSSCAPPIRP